MSACHAYEYSNGRCGEKPLNASLQPALMVSPTFHHFSLVDHFTLLWCTQVLVKITQISINPTLQTVLTATILSLPSRWAAMEIFFVASRSVHVVCSDHNWVYIYIGRKNLFYTHLYCIWHQWQLRMGEQWYEEETEVLVPSGILICTRPKCQPQERQVGSREWFVCVTYIAITSLALARRSRCLQLANVWYFQHTAPTSSWCL
jgi:hypothetical protein